MDLVELLKLEHAGWKSLCSGTGSDFYGRLMTADGVMILAHGQVMDREQVIDSLREAPRWSSYDIDDVHLIPLGDSAAVLVYRGAAYREGPSAAFVALMASVYVRRGEHWALASYQQTPLVD